MKIRVWYRDTISSCPIEIDAETKEEAIALADEEETKTDLDWNFENVGSYPEFVEIDQIDVLDENGEIVKQIFK